jgi:hypothetical protein
VDGQLDEQPAVALRRGRRRGHQDDIDPSTCFAFALGRGSVVYGTTEGAIIQTTRGGS